MRERERFFVAVSEKKGREEEKKIVFYVENGTTSTIRTVE